MTTRPTISWAENLLKEGKIRAFTVTKRNPIAGAGKLLKPSKEKAWIAWNLLAWCYERELELKVEHRFHPVRLWRFDWCIPGIMVAVEYNGVFSDKSRHLTAKGHSGDADKLNAAQSRGWRVIQVTPLNYKTLLTQLNNLWTSSTNRKYPGETN